MPTDLDVEFRQRLLDISESLTDGFSNSSNRKFSEIEGWIASSVGLQPGSVLCLFSSKQNFHNRLEQAQKRARRTVRGRLGLVVYITPDVEELASWVPKFPCDVVLICRSDASPKRISKINLEAIHGSGQNFERICDVFPEVPHETASDTRHFDVGGGVHVDARIRRMVRLSIASNCGVLLVGPPGTGKSTLLREILDEIRQSPSRYGLDSVPNEPKWVTAEEGWTTRDLVGGETVDESQRLRFALGHVLDAIREDRWIVIDEANRADMDKIFGSLMTWMGQREPDQFVDLGRASTNPNAAMVQLGWTNTSTCIVNGLHRLTAEEVGEQPIQFMAGRDWRLLGTYNARDAHRVFRFGHALGRRFVRVPIPPPTPTEFGDIIPNWGLPKSVGERVGGLYAAHFEDASTQLGPALFRALAEYMRAADLEEAPEEQAFAEGYVVAMGSSLAALDEDEFDALRQRIVARGLLTATELEWVRSLLPPLV
jgi:energy-coupling factor transporter ATP-binding protein EcfA2